MRIPSAIGMSNQYRVLTWCLWTTFCVQGKIKVQGRDHLPARPYIVASNHISNWDPVTLGMAFFHEQLHPLGKQEIFDVPVIGKLPAWLGGVPVKRGAVDRDTIKQCRDILKSGHSLMLLPEGTRSKTGGLAEPKPGIIFLAQLAQVPIIPVGLWGTEEMKHGRPWNRATVHVNIGKPIYVSRSKHDRDTEMDRLMTSIAALLPPEYRGMYADNVVAQSSD